MFDVSKGDFRDGMPFLGGRIWIDLVNSTSIVLGDLIKTSEGWRLWATAAGLNSAGERAELERQADEARELRSAFARIFDPLAAAQSPPIDAVRTINAQLSTMASYTKLEPDGDRLIATEIAIEPPTAVGKLAMDFADFLGTYEPHRLRHCGNPECSMVFYDSAKNGTRRWCSMESCGNRHKVRAHRARRSQTTIRQ